jgi:hypothetical protein
VCKTIYVHPGCYKKWLQTTCPDILVCSVCKSTVSITFVKQFVTLEQFMMYPHNIREPNEVYEISTRDGISIPGIAEFILVENDELQYKNPKQKDRVKEASKRLHKSEHLTIPSYKKPFCF